MLSLEFQKLRRPARIAGLTIALLLFLQPFGSQPVLAHGCGTSDHTIGEFPGWEIHYYEGHFVSGNSRFAKWQEVSGASVEWTQTFCGCVNPNIPCYNLLAGMDSNVHVDSH